MTWYRRRGTVGVAPSAGHRRRRTVGPARSTWHRQCGTVGVAPLAAPRGRHAVGVAPSASHRQRRTVSVAPSASHRQRRTVSVAPSASRRQNYLKYFVDFIIVVLEGKSENPFDVKLTQDGVADVTGVTRRHGHLRQAAGQRCPEKVTTFFRYNYLIISRGR
jgi:hypothetical protein